MAEQTYKISDIFEKITSEKENISIFVSPENSFHTFTDKEKCFEFIHNLSWMRDICQLTRNSYPPSIQPLFLIKGEVLRKFYGNLKLDDLRLSFLKYEEDRIVSLTNSSHFIQFKESSTAKEIFDNFQEHLREAYIKYLMGSTAPRPRPSFNNSLLSSNEQVQQTLKRYHNRQVQSVNGTTVAPKPAPSTSGATIPLPKVASLPPKVAIPPAVNAVPEKVTTVTHSKSLPTVTSPTKRKSPITSKPHHKKRKS